MRKIIIIAIIIAAVIGIAFVIVPIFGADRTGGSMSVQHYNEEGEPVGAPLTYGGWLGSESEPVVAVTVVLSWSLSMSGIDEATIVVTGRIDIEIDEQERFEVTFPPSSVITDSKTYTWTLADILQIGYDHSICFTGTINAYGYDDTGVRVDAEEWTGLVTISYTWDDSSLVIQGNIGT